MILMKCVCIFVSTNLEHYVGDLELHVYYMYAVACNIYQEVH